MYSESYDYRKSPPAMKRTLTTYDKKGRILKVIEFDGDSLPVSTELFEYDRKGNEILHEIRGKGDVVSERTSTTFDKWSNPVSKTEFELKENKQTTTDYLYNSLNDKTLETVRDDKGKIIRTISYVYDNKGILIERTVRNESGDILLKRTNKAAYK